MSTGTFDSAIASCRSTDLEPVALPASALESTAPEYLRGLRAELNDDGRTPAELTASVAFDEDCSLAVQETVDRVRELVRTASHVGASRVTLDVEVAPDIDEGKATTALDAARERARREGVTLVVNRNESS
jgi:hypothetical protein